MCRSGTKPSFSSRYSKMRGNARTSQAGCHHRSTIGFDPAAIVSQKIAEPLTQFHRVWAHAFLRPTHNVNTGMRGKRCLFLGRLWQPGQSGQPRQAGL